MTDKNERNSATDATLPSRWIVGASCSTVPALQQLGIGGVFAANLRGCLFNLRGCLFNGSRRVNLQRHRWREK
jgi:hypothetical protein